MNRLLVLCTCLPLLTISTLCQADTLTITYRSGKTQTVELGEPVQSISSWQFSGIDAASSTISAPALPEKPAAAAAPTGLSPDRTKVKPPANKSSGMRVNLNAKPLQD